MALDSDCVLISRNAEDMDLLLQIKPNAQVLLYENQVSKPSFCFWTLLRPFRHTSAGWATPLLAIRR
jgi:hypothetical protein